MLRVRVAVNPVVNVPSDFRVCGELVISTSPISLLGEVNPESGEVLGIGSVVNKIFIFPSAVGSTVGSYVLYGLRVKGKCPKAIVVKDVDTVTIVGAVLADIPMLKLVSSGWAKIVELLRGGRSRLQGCLEGGYLVVEEGYS